ncbi:SurA N-terminal domain-containing protein [Ideonella sp. A 288]|uniref:SurA N-terminal domain-containing protein n=1 Tax=Ideonella sp. A 288 TaxID=1962181 RepID=UPI000B4A835F|nr:SurA N-terminal domain-containing protein [Ideonella sp. A 288]
MFDFVRSHTRLLQLLLLLLILPSFVVFGIQGYSSFSEGGNQNVATVDGQGITQAEWDAAHQQQVQRVRQEMPNLDPKLFDSPLARSETLDALIRDRVLATAARKLHLGVSDERLHRLFVSEPQYAQLRNADGSVNKDLLAAQGMSSEMFASRLRQDMAVQQVLRGVADTTVAPSSATSAAFDAVLQRREVKFVRFDTKDYLARVNPTDADVEAFHKAHEAEFKAPEQATIEYAVLDLEVLKKGITVAEDDLRKYYDENVARYTVAEERRARHILIKADKDAASDVKQKAKAKAETLLAEARKNPAGFADLARKNSEDTGTAAQGGDLDFFGRGAMVKAFEDAAFALKAGEISPVIETDFGYHVIQLEATRGGDRKPFDAVRSSIEEDVRRQLATKRWAEAAEQFTNTVYEQADSLQPVIDKLKLEKLTATVMRSPAPDAKGALASQKLLEAVFSGESIKNKRNTDAVEVGSNQLASARIVSHQPARTRPLSEVKASVQVRVKASQAAALARTEGAARLAQLQKDPAAELPTQAIVSRATPEGFERRALDAVLRADAGKLPAVVGIDLEDRGYLVVRVDKVLPPELPPGQADTMKAQFAQLMAQAEGDAYYKALKSRFKAVVVAKVPTPASAAAAGN